MGTPRLGELATSMFDSFSFRPGLRSEATLVGPLGVTRSRVLALLLTSNWVCSAPLARAADAPPPPVPPPLEEGGEPGTTDEEETSSASLANQNDSESEIARESDSKNEDGPGSSLRLHAVIGLAKAVAGYQRSEFGFGSVALAAVEWGPSPIWGIQAEVGFAGLAGTKKEPPQGLAELDGAAGATLGAGFRVRPFAKAKNRSPRAILYPQGPWLSAAVGGAWTDGTLAPLVDAFLGYDFAVSENLALGPTAGYLLVLQTRDEQPRDDSAHLVVFGLHGTFDSGVSEEQVMDRDHDGILDVRDACPDDAEDKDGFEDGDGCPEADNDGDEIVDTADRCPLDPEDRDEFEDEDGCPEPDNDGDGVLDVDDECLNESEDKDGFRDEDGCPDADNDLDGIADLKDLCPNEPETRNGVSDNDGCPDEESVRVVGDKIELDQKIHFWTNSDRIRPLSYPVLEQLAKFLVAHPEYVHVSIEGHADARGEEDFNLRLSKERAKSILEFLVTRGVEADRLASEGFGSSRPLVEGDTEHAWFMNRRVEFVVTRNRQITVDPKTGAPISVPADEEKP